MKKTFLSNLISGPHMSSSDRELRNAEKRAEKIVEDAVTKADEMLRKVDLLTDELRGQVKIGLQQTLEKNSLVIEAEIKKAVATLLSDFRLSLQQQIKITQQELSNKAQQELAAVLKDIAAYKEAQLKTIDDQIIKKVLSISEKIVSDTIPQKTHERLIIEALEKAKKAGLFET